MKTINKLSISYASKIISRFIMNDLKEYFYIKHNYLYYFNISLILYLQNNNKFL